MVRRGSTVRVRQRASRKSLQIGQLVCPDRKRLSRAGTSWCSLAWRNSRRDSACSAHPNPSDALRTARGPRNMPRNSREPARSHWTALTERPGTGTTRSDRDPALSARTSGIYLRADPSDLQVLEGDAEQERAELIAQRLREWKSASNTFDDRTRYAARSAGGERAYQVLLRRRLECPRPP